MSIKHAKVSAKSDGGDSTLVLPSDWNAAHVGGTESLVTDTSVSGATTVDRDDGATHDLTLTGDATLTPDHTTAVAGEAIDLRIIIRQDGTGGHTLDWGGTITWAEGSEPTMPTAANAAITVGLLSVDDATSWLGYAIGDGADSVATDAIWDAAGDLAVGSGANTASRLAAGSEGNVLTISSGVPAWVAAGGPTYTDWTPALTAASTNPTLGSGSTAAGRYAQTGDLVHAVGCITFGTSGTNAGSGNYRVSLPVNMRAPVNNDGNVVGYAYLLDSSTSNVRFAILRYVSASTVAVAYDSSTSWLSVAHNAPWAWAASDRIEFALTYEAD